MPQKKPGPPPEYAIAAPSVSVPADNGSGKASRYILSAGGGNVRPPIGPETGPDPRNSDTRMCLPGRPVFHGANGIRFDFNYGYRVETPPGSRDYLLKVYDLDTQTLLDTHHMHAGEIVTGSRKYFIRCRLEVYDQESGNLIFGHEYDCADRKVVIVIPDGGLGDNLAWLPYVAEFKDRYRARVTCVCGEWLIRLVRDQYLDIDFVPVTQGPDMKDCYAGYFCAIFPESRKDWRPAEHQHWGMQGSVALLLGLEPVPRRVRLPLPAARTIPEPYVCISAMATNPAKYWNYPDGWNILCRYLKRLGFRVLVIDRDRELNFAGRRYGVPEEAEDFTGLKPIRERMELLQHAEFFVGLPSGLSWLAWNCGIPVVMLSGFTLDGSEFPTPYRVTNLKFCHGCWNDTTLFFDMTAPVWCPRHLGTAREIECTRAITPKMVLETVDRIPAVRRRLKPPVTFAIPVYNAPAAHLAPMLDSVIAVAANYHPAEILIRDDGSTEPETGEILRDYCRRYPGLLSVVFAETNLGICASRQELLLAACGKYLVSFDQDDIMLPFDLEGVVAAMEEHPERVASYSRKYFFDERGLTGETGAAPYSPFMGFFVMTPVSNATVFRVEAMKRCGGYLDIPPTIGDDVGLFLRLAGCGVCDFDVAGPRVLARKQEGRSGARFGNGSSADSRNFTRKLVASYPEQYARIMNLELPDGEPHVVAGLLGAAFSLHPENPGFRRKICEMARGKFPDDYGVREISLLDLRQAGDREEFRLELLDSLKRFSRNTPEQLRLLAAADDWRQHVPKGEEKFAELCVDDRKTPGMVLDALRKLLPQGTPPPGVVAPSVRISVIICVFGARYIRECVESVVRAFKDYGRTEILLYDDASYEEGTAVLLDNLAVEFPDMVKVWHGSRNIGVALGRDFLVGKARGEYIVSFDHDDVMLPFDVAKVVAFMDEHPEYSASYAPKYLFRDEKGCLDEIHGSAFSYFTAFFAPRVNINATFLRRDRLSEAGGFRRVNNDKRSGWDDIYLLVRMARAGDLYFDPEPRCLYRIHPQQITHSKPPWDDWITETVCEEYRPLYDRILAGDIPDVHGADFRIVRGLMGAAVFRHQRDRAITGPIMEAALREFPDDAGLWEVYYTLLLMDGRHEEIRRLWPEAVRLLSDKPAAVLAILDMVLHSWRRDSATPPEELAAHVAHLRQQYFAPPAIVLAALRKNRRKNQKTYKYS